MGEWVIHSFRLLGDILAIVMLLQINQLTACVKVNQTQFIVYNSVGYCPHYWQIFSHFAPHAWSVTYIIISPS